MNCEVLQISENEFLQHYIQNAPHIMWFLGAGASRSAGLPTATDIVWDLKRRYYCLHENQDLQSHDINNSAIKKKIQEYMDSKGFPELSSPEEYSFYFDLVFENDYQAQQRYIQESLCNDKVSLNIGHRALSGLLGMGQAKVVFTTNFDEVLETAFAEVVGRNLSAYHLEGSYAALDALNSDNFPLYAKIHGDFRYQSIKNLSRDLCNNDKEIQKCFLAAASRYGLVVSGYSGRDANVISMLLKAMDQNNAFPYGLFWTTPRISQVEKSVRELITVAKGKGIRTHIVEVGTFDEMLSKIWRQIKDKPQMFDGKVRTAHVARVSIPVPNPGKQFPILRTNALPVFLPPQQCGSVELGGSFTYLELKKKIIEESPDAILTYTNKIFFWGNSKEIAKVIPANQTYTIRSFKIENGAKLVSESTFMKAFFDEALAKALCNEKPLFLRRKGRTNFAVVQADAANDQLFSRLRKALGDKDRQGNVTGSVSSLRDVIWSESISIQLEERGGYLWAMLTPDIWIEPLEKRKEAVDFLRQHRLKRYNNKSYYILDAWIEILLGEVGQGKTVRVSCFQGTEYVAKLEIGTRTAFSRGG